MCRKFSFFLVLALALALLTGGKADRAVPLTGVRNARELGGYAAADGRTVRQGVLLRTAKLSGAAEEDLHVLVSGYHLAVVVDFRGDTEIEAAPDPEIGGVKYLNLPVIDDSAGPPEEMEAEIEALMEQNGEITGPDRLRLAIKYGAVSDQMYVDFLSHDQGKAGYSRFFRELLALEDGRAILFHCSEGKDRTGCAAMLILFALGADEKTVMEDFLLTNEFNADLIEADRQLLREEGIPEEEMDLCLPMMDQVSPAYMAAAILWMTETCGSPLGYITQELGVTEAEIEELRNKFLE